jgi:hypothetical protein
VTDPFLIPRVWVTRKELEEFDRLTTREEPTMEIQGADEIMTTRPSGGLNELRDRVERALAIADVLTERLAPVMTSRPTQPSEEQTGPSNELRAICQRVDELCTRLARIHEELDL